jgi:leucyl aminopeptidase
MTTPTFRLSLQTTPLSDVTADWLVVGLGSDAGFDEATSELNQRMGGTISRVREQGDFAGKHLDLLPIYQPKGIQATRVLLVGLGPSLERTRSVLHDAASAALRSITTRHYAKVAIALPEANIGSTLNEIVLGIGAGAYQGSYGPDLRKAERSRSAPDELSLVSQSTSPELDRLRQRAEAEGRAITTARELVNLPPCDLYPETFAARATTLGVECEIWDEKRLADERMGAILGVAQASTRPARFVILRYRNGGNAPMLAYVGKGVTFDSGGLSIKDNDQMADMKCDMAGAAAVLASIQAIAELQLKVNVMGVMPLVENMPGGKALKLGDVLTARNGKTIEVLNTDAEGRLILADALAYAAEQKPHSIVDLATLTGSCMIALGTEIAGLMTNHPAWGETVRNAITRAGERSWPLPMDADFDSLLKSNVADLKNVAGTRYGGAIVGGKFLKQFVGEVPWVHLDIAGPAWCDHETSARDAGGTGAYVRSLIELALEHAQK